MKKILLICAMMLCLGITDSMAQTRREQRAAEKALKEQVEAYTRDGWTVSPGQVSLADQIKRSSNLQQEMDDEGFPKYVTGTGQSIGNNYDAAKMQALEIAKLEIARKLQGEIAAGIKTTMANNQEDYVEAESITTTSLASRNFINQHLGRVLTLMECYRIMPNKNKEVLVIVACSYRVALDAARNEVKKKLEDESKELFEQLDAKFNN